MKQWSDCLERQLNRALVAAPGTYPHRPQVINRELLLTSWRRPWRHVPGDGLKHSIETQQARVMLPSTRGRRGRGAAFVQLCCLPQSQPNITVEQAQSVSFGLDY